MDPDREGVVAGAFDHGQQLDHVPEALGEVDVHRRIPVIPSRMTSSPATS